MKLDEQADGWRDSWRYQPRKWRWWRRWDRRWWFPTPWTAAAPAPSRRCCCCRSRWDGLICPPVAERPSSIVGILSYLPIRARQRGASETKLMLLPRSESLCPSGSQPAESLRWARRSLPEEGELELDWLGGAKPGEDGRPGRKRESRETPTDSDVVWWTGAHGRVRAPVVSAHGSIGRVRVTFA